MFEVDTFSITNVTDIFIYTGLNTTSWILLTVYNALLIFIGIFGSLYLLYVSFSHNAIKLGRTSLMFVHNLIITDFFWTILMFLPGFTTLVGRRWVLGEVVCGITAAGFSLPIFNKAFTILAFTGTMIQYFNIVPSSKIDC